MRSLPIFVAALALSSCNTPPQPSEKPKQPAPSPSRSLRFEAAAGDKGYQAAATLQAQVTLDRLGFSPGVIDGKEGESYRMAIRGFQEVQGLPQSGTLDDQTSVRLTELNKAPATRLVIIPAAFAAGPFAPDFPEDAGGQAKLPALAYRNLMEALAERFHTTSEMLIALNSPSTRIGPGAVIRVPNVESAAIRPIKGDERGWAQTLERLGVSSEQPRASELVVDKSDGTLQVFDERKKLIAQFPATMGSEHDPLPLGTWEIKGVSRNPDFHYNPKLFWDVSDSEETQVMKPGPNSPVGVVWIDLNKPHYGIHGTSEPQQIGRAESHGCVRLTNWDAARLAQMVKPGTPARFQA